MVARKNGRKLLQIKAQRPQVDRLGHGGEKVIAHRFSMSIACKYSKISRTIGKSIVFQKLIFQKEAEKPSVAHE
jgi:hypothetical protein